MLRRACTTARIHALPKTWCSSAAASTNVAARPMRSVLYTPGSSKHLLKARTSSADCSLIDLEDGVAPSAKLRARKAVLDVVGEGGFGGRLVAVRVNALDTEWGWDDLEAVAGLKRVDAIALPKVESAEEVQEVASFLNKSAANQDIRIWPMIETPKGVQKVDDIAAAHERVSTIVLGTSDLSRDLRSLHTRDRMPLIYALSRCVVAARASNIQ
eukprot:17462-Heterococcus_DN1.PRE.2